MGQIISSTPPTTPIMRSPQNRQHLLPCIMPHSMLSIPAITTTILIITIIITIIISQLMYSSLTCQFTLCVHAKNMLTADRATYLLLTIPVQPVPIRAAAAQIVCPPEFRSRLPDPQKGAAFQSNRVAISVLLGCCPMIGETPDLFFGMLLHVVYRC